MKPIKCDFLICGAGIIGLTIANQLVRDGFQNITIIEKEFAIGQHASGRNSGVLHAGIYYTPESLKAQSCLRGNFLLKEYCHQKNIPVLESGKVIVAQNDEEIETLNELYKRAVENGAKVEMISERKLKEIEPNAKTYQTALFSYYTAVVDPKLILESLYKDLVSTEKVEILTNTKFINLEDQKVARTNNREIKFEIFVNSAGSFCDKIAHIFGIGLDYKIIPFKGLYKKLKKEKAHLVKGNIYPVPDVRNPFLGVQFTRDITGSRT